MLPSQSDTGSATYTFGQNAQSATITSTGELQFLDSSGKKTADHSFSGMRTLTLPASQLAYTIDGTTTINDNLASSTATLVGTGLQSSSSCCRPTAGTLMIARTGGSQPGQHTWAFGPSCGDVTRDGSSVALPACE